MPLPSKPATVEWATDTNYASGPDMGQATKLAPTAGEIESGFIRGQRPPARKMNYFRNLLCQWAQWSDDAAEALAVDLADLEARMLPSRLETFQACTVRNDYLWWSEAHQGAYFSSGGFGTIKMTRAIHEDFDAGSVTMDDGDIKGLAENDDWVVITTTNQSNVTSQAAYKAAGASPSTAWTQIAGANTVHWEEVFYGNGYFILRNESNAIRYFTDPSGSIGGAPTMPGSGTVYGFSVNATTGVICLVRGASLNVYTLSPPYSSWGSPGVLGGAVPSHSGMIYDPTLDRHLLNLNGQILAIRDTGSVAAGYSILTAPYADDETTPTVDGVHLIGGYYVIVLDCGSFNRVYRTTDLTSPASTWDIMVGAPFDGNFFVLKPFDGRLQVDDGGTIYFSQRVEVV